MISKNYSALTTALISKYDMTSVMFEEISTPLDVCIGSVWIGSVRKEIDDDGIFRKRQKILWK